MNPGWDTGLETFADIEAFYAADERRRFSGEADYGLYWWEGSQGYSDQWRVSAVMDTAEVYAVMERPHTRRVVLLGQFGHGPDWRYQSADACLAGWNLVCGQEESLQWAVDRVRAAARVAGSGEAV